MCTLVHQQGTEDLLLLLTVTLFRRQLFDLIVAFAEKRSNQVCCTVRVRDICSMALSIPVWHTRVLSRNEFFGGKDGKVHPR